MKLTGKNDKAIVLKQIIEQSPVVVFLWKNEEGWPVELVSENIKQLLGYSAEDFLNGTINYSDLVYREDIQNVAKGVKQFSDNDFKMFKHEPYRIVAKNGRIIWVDDQTSVRKNENGDVTHYQGVISDISEKIKTVRQLGKVSEVVEHTANMVIITDIHGNIEYVNPKFTELMGYTLDEVIGKKTSILSSGLQTAEYYKELWATVQKGKVWNGEFVNKTKQGKLINEKARISPVKDENGNILNYISIKEDVTVKLEAEKALKESKEMQEIILNGMDEALYLSSTENDILYMNNAMIKKIGRNAVGQKCYHAIYSKDSVCRNCYFETLKEKGTTDIEIDKEGRKYKVSSTLLKNNSKLTVYYDITDRKENEKLKRTQKELIKSKERFKGLFTSLPNGIIHCDPVYGLNGSIVDFIFIDMNTVFEQLVGLNKDELIGKKYSETLKDMNQQFYSIVDKAIKNGDPERFEMYYRLIKKHCSINIFKTEENTFAAIFVDISDRVTAEKALEKSYTDLEISKEKAEESDRLKTLFLENMSHEIRTPMNGIIGFAELLSDSELTEDQKNKYIEVIQENSNHLLDIITDIMDIAKIEAGKVKIKEVKTNINDMLADLISLYQLPAQKKNIQLMIPKSLTDCTIYTDYTKLRQILENLVGNAIKFTDKGHIKIFCELKDEKLLFSIEDTGIGIRTEYQETIFDRFSQADNSSTRIYGGTGLGLSISQAYVHELGGNIWLKSEPEKGTTFYFTIPYKPVNQIEFI